MTEKLNISVKNMEETERIKSYISSKISKLDRYMGDIEEINIDLAFMKSARNAADRHAAQITLYGRHVTLRTEEYATDVLAAFDNALDKMQRKIERYKGKRNHGRGDGTPASEAVPEAVIMEDETQEEPVIVRRKQFTLSPMNELEAIEQMRLLEHDNFFVFYNADTSAINILYRRRDGTYGLIEPKLG
ncbi:MAG: ribosome-associated translation inhibitor RaiA [Anaerolineaceae bacterium]|jgi:putative sigma-54 modulation protein